MGIFDNPNEWSASVERRLAELNERNNDLSRRILAQREWITQLERRVEALETHGPGPNELVIGPDDDLNVSCEAARMQGKRLVLRPGIYEDMLDSPKGPLEIVGQNRAAIVAPPPGAPFAANFATDHCVDIRISNVKFSGINAEHDTCKIHYTGTPSNTPRSLTFVRCQFHSGSRNGILCVGLTRDLEFVDCSSFGNGSSWRDHGLYIACQGVSVSGGSYNHNKGWGISTWIETPGQHGVDYVDGVLIQQADLHDNGLSGRGFGLSFGRANGADEGVIALRNRVWNNREGGLQLWRAENCELRANHLYGSNREIHIGPGVSGQIIEDNVDHPEPSPDG